MLEDKTSKSFVLVYSALCIL